MKKGKVRIIIGFILVLLQLLSVLGNAKSGAKISLSFDNPNIFLYDLIWLFSYFLVGISALLIRLFGNDYGSNVLPFKGFSVCVACSVNVDGAD
ncbi:MAG: hypothetical protein IKB88_08885 [Clostridia bacterium]|nr:hypothetical protein [Clostridia bacterium]